MDKTYLELLGEHRGRVDATWIGRVGSALECGRFEFAFQGVHHVRGERPALYQECLSRVHDSDGTLIAPKIFVPCFERLGISSWFDHNILDRGMRLLDQHPTLTLGVNVSAQSLSDDALWQELFEHWGDRPTVMRRLVLEITETSPLGGEGMLNAVAQLKEAGCRIAIDDLGMGYSIDAAMRLRGIDIIKIDRVFIAAVSSGRVRVRHLANLVALAADAAEHVVIEGVENETELKLVQETGANWVQGFHFGHPSSELCAM